MAIVERIGTVDDLWRFPVKSLRGERLTEAFVTEQGIQGDRAYALLDVETGRVVSASNSHFPGILDCTATFVEPFTEANAMLPPVRITLPTGASATSDSPVLSALLSDYFHRETELIATIPASYASRQAEFFTEVGLDLTAPTQSFMDLCPLSLISTTTLASLGHDRRRFRMNVIVRTEGDGFLDNAWLHHQLTIGEQLQLAVTMLDPRCVMTTLPQQELPRDPSILKSIVALNSQPIGTGKARPCAGVYASVLHPGTLLAAWWTRILAPPSGAVSSINPSITSPVVVKPK